MTQKIDQNPSDTEETKDQAPETVAAPQTEAATESITSPMDPMSQLQADLEAAKAEIAEWQDRFLRKAAEFENYRKRTEKAKIEVITQAKSSVLIEFLPIADACERALKIFADSDNTESNLQQYQDGVELLYRQVLDTLSRTGVVAVEAEGKPFDPHLHEAIAREETPDFKEGTILKELRRGYLFQDKLLRPTQVIVASHPQGKDSIPQ